MILILTSAKGDFSHIELINWLNFMHADYIVLSGDTILSGKDNISIRNNNCFINNVNLNTVSCCFYRRWYSYSLDDFKCFQELSGYRNGIISNLSNELNEIKAIIQYYTRHAIWVPKPEAIYNNKIPTLLKASKIGLNIPRFIITTKKDDVIEFTKDKQCITKAIGNLSFVTDSSMENGFSPIRTKEMSKDIISKLPDTFFPTLVQEFIEKSMEIRVFYFMGKFYSTAIISQDSVKTIIDSRVVENDDFSSLSAFKLPKKNEILLEKLMNELDLNTGSIDLLIDKKGKIFFLEVNPVGQFSGYSKRSGYNFEKEMAKQLMIIDYEYRRIGKKNK